MTHFGKSVLIIGLLHGCLAVGQTGGEILLGIDRGVEAEHHLFPGLLTPCDFGLGIGISQVLGRIVEVSRAMQLGSLRH